ncbi:MAG: transcriptional regulator [Hymenobacter sp.]|jgi:DNA-binding HxlR family transcriptional regulator|nr:MAG: transcriptional regulator [Hymenobacter sp.]
MKKPTSTNALNLAELLHTCPMLYGMQRLSGRYKVALLWHISQHHNRFGVLRKLLHPVTTKMLSQQLRELEADGLISRTIYAEMPPRVEYALLPEAEALLGVLEGLRAWGDSLKQRTLSELAATTESEPG